MAVARGQVGVLMGRRYIRHKETGQVLLAVPRGGLAAADLRLVALDGAFLRRAKLFATDLRGSRLAHADLCRCDLRFSNLGGAVLRASLLRGADMRGCLLCGADLRCADMRGVRLTLAVYDTSAQWPHRVSPERLGAWPVQRACVALGQLGQYAHLHGLGIQLSTRWDTAEYRLLWRSGLGWNALEVAVAGDEVLIGVMHRKGWRGMPRFLRRVEWMNWTTVSRHSDWATIRQHLDDARRYLANRVPGGSD